MAPAPVGGIWKQLPPKLGGIAGLALVADDASRVHAADSVSPQVHGDVTKTELLQRGGDRIGLFEQARALLRGDLDPGQTLMHPHPDPCISAPPEKALCFLHPIQVFHGNPPADGKAGKQTGIGGLVPGRQSQGL
jgi:hypothetical protein